MNMNLNINPPFVDYESSAWILKSSLICLLTISKILLPGSMTFFRLGLHSCHRQSSRLIPIWPCPWAFLSASASSSDVAVASRWNFKCSFRLQKMAVKCSISIEISEGFPVWSFLFLSMYSLTITSRTSYTSSTYFPIFLFKFRLRSAISCKYKCSRSFDIERE